MYTAPTEPAARERFAEFTATWGSKYPRIIRMWESTWAEFVRFLAFEVEVRRVIFSTNAIESLNARFRRAVRARGHFRNEQAALKACTSPFERSIPAGQDASGGPCAGSRCQRLHATVRRPHLPRSGSSWADGSWT